MGNGGRLPISQVAPSADGEGVLYEVFLNIWKDRNALNREQCVDILMVYGIGLHTDRILRHYWYNL